MFLIPLRRPNAQSVVKGLISIFTSHVYVPQIIITDKGTAFTAELVKRTMEQAGISIKDARTIGMIEPIQEKLKIFLKTTIGADQPQWDHYVNIAVLAHNTTYHAPLKDAPTEIFHGRTPHSALDLKCPNLFA